MRSGRLIEKKRFLTESPNPFYKKFTEASDENLNVKKLDCQSVLSHHTQ